MDKPTPSYAKIFSLLAGLALRPQLSFVAGCAQSAYPKACTAQYSSGNGRADCQEGSVSICYAAADSCVRSAARACGEIESQCPGSSAGFVLLFAGIGYVGIRRG
ncbi:MAG: hypothetical protein AB1529_00055 [Candidatus Micrarchaeota archaeon]